MPQPTLNVVDANSNPVTVNTINPNGQAAMADSQPVVIANNQSAIPTTVSSSALPTGAATAANQATEIASLASIDGKITAVNTGAVVVASSALPSGAATAANQTTGNASLSSIDGKTPALGQAAMAASTPVAIASNQSAIPVTVSSIALPTGASTEAKQDTGNASLASIDSKNPALVGGRVPVDGSGVTQPVSAASLPLPTGAATAANQTTGNSSLSSIDTKLPAQGAALIAASIPVNIASNQTVPVSAASLPLPTGAATAANQTTANGSLASIDGKITACNTGAVTVSSSALPTGAATAAKQPALGVAGTPSSDVITVQGAAGMEPLDVNIGSIALPTGASTEAKQDTQITSLQLLDDVVLTEDAAHTTGDKGVMSLAVRNDSNASLVGTNGDYAPLQVDANGNLKVNVVVGGGGGGGGGTSAQDDSAFTAGTTQVTPIGGFFNNSSPDSVDEGDVGAVRMTANRSLHNTIRDAAGNERGANVTAANALVVDGSAVTQPVSAASLPLPTGAATEATLAASATLFGAVNETAPGTDTASSGLNGRLQRIAQRLTSLIAQIPAALGITTAANSLSIAPASDAIFQCDGLTLEVSAQFNRPADTTAYAALDTVADSTSSPTVMSWTGLGASGYVTKAFLGTTQSTNTARYRLHLYRSTLTNTNDNAAFTILSTDFAAKVGTIDFVALRTEGTGSTMAESINSDIRLGYNFPSGSTLFGRLETLDAFTPASGQTFVIKLLVEKNR